MILTLLSWFSRWGAEDGAARASRRASARDVPHESVVRELPAGHPDWQVVTQLRGEEATARVAFEQLFRAHYARLCTVADVLTEDAAQSEEIVSDVLAWLWGHRMTWRPSVSVEAYLISAVRNRARNAIRDARARARLLALHGEEDDAVRPSIPAAPDAAAESDGRGARLAAALRALPPMRRLIVALRWQRQLSWTEIAAALDVSVAAAQMQHSRALRTLRALLEPGGG